MMIRAFPLAGAPLPVTVIVYGNSLVAGSLGPKTPGPTGPDSHLFAWHESCGNGFGEGGGANTIVNVVLDGDSHVMVWGKPIQAIEQSAVPSARTVIVRL